MRLLGCQAASAAAERLLLMSSPILSLLKFDSQHISLKALFVLLNAELRWTA